MKHVWWKGRCVPEQEACIPVLSPGILYGEGVFRTLKIQDGIVESFSIHLERFQKDCIALRLKAPHIDPEWIKALIQANQARNGAWRHKWIAPCIGHGATELLMTLEPYSYAVTSARLCVYPYPLASPLARYKTLAYLDHMKACHYAKEQGYDEAVVSDPEGNLLECSAANLFWQWQDVLHFPDPALPFLEGTTVAMIQTLCKQKQWPMRFVRCSLSEIPQGAQVYMCNAMRGIIPIQSIGAVEYPQHAPFLQELKQAYRRAVEPFHFK